MVMAESHLRAETLEARCFSNWSSPKVVSLTGLKSRQRSRDAPYSHCFGVPQKY